jgi:hypothetical protein
MIIAVWFLIPISSATVAAGSDVKPTSSAAELSTIRGVVKATAQATLASQVQGRISQLPYRKGSGSKKGLS